MSDDRDPDPREPSGHEIDLVETLRDASADSLRADAYEARLLRMGFTRQGLANMAAEWRKRIIGK